MRRRKLLGFFAGATLGYPILARAQREKMPVIGWLGIGMPSNPETPPQALSAFRQGLGEMSFVEGRNLRFDYRWAAGRYDRLPALAADLVAAKVDLIIAQGGSPPALAAKNATSTIPIVFVTGGDPVATGLVGSLARPGGNVTGVSILFGELGPKQIELLSELVPQAKRIGLLISSRYSKADTTVARFLQNMREAAGARHVQLEILDADSEAEIDAAFANLARSHAGALVVGPFPLFSGRRVQLVAAAERRRIPTMYFAHEFISAGGLISYGPSLAAAFHLAGIYAGRILKGEKPADLPVQQPTKFDLAINLKTAKTLGLAVPQLVLARANEVIQ
jgi:ABC-type uncharacterized transport system substrate-binding protein